MKKVKANRQLKLKRKGVDITALLISSDALEALLEQLSSYALERYCKALENEGDLIDSLEIDQQQKHDLHTQLDDHLQYLHQGELVSPQQTLNKLVALGESATAAEAVLKISKTLKQLDCKVTTVQPLESKARWDELMACTGEALVERHLLVD